MTLDKTDVVGFPAASRRDHPKSGYLLAGTDMCRAECPHCNLGTQIVSGRLCAFEGISCPSFAFGDPKGPRDAFFRRSNGARVFA